VTRQDVLKVRQRVTLVSRNNQVVVSKWPRRRGPAKSARQQAWINRFKCLARGLKSPDPITLDGAKFWAQQIRIKSASPMSTSGWYYRDVLARAAYGKLLSYQGAKRITTPTAMVRRLTNESRAGSSFLSLTPNEEIWDTNQFWSPTVNPTRLTIRSPGLYLFGCDAIKKTVGTGNQLVAIYKNGSVDMCELKALTAPVDQHYPLSSINYFETNDYLEVKIFTASGPLNWQLLNFWIVGITPEGIL